MSDRELFLIDGATEFAGARDLAGMLRRWPRLRRELVSSPGYVSHQVWYGFPTTIGLFTWWESEEALYAFARSHEHEGVWRWAVSEGSTRGGWLVVYRMQRGGPLWGNGVERRVRTFRRFVRAPSDAPPDPPHHG